MRDGMRIFHAFCCNLWLIGRCQSKAERYNKEVLLMQEQPRLLTNHVQTYKDQN